MRISVKLALMLFAGVLAVSTCREKQKTYKPIAQWEQYHDQFTGLRFTHPLADSTAWLLNTDGNRVSITASYEAAERFLDPRTDDKRDNDLDIQIIVSRERPDSLIALDEIVNAYTKEKKSERFTVTPTDTIMIDSTEARKFSYIGNYKEDGTAKVSTTRIYAIRDSVVYCLEYAAFNDLFQPYSGIMDSLQASIRLPRPRPKGEAADESLPSITFTEFSNNFLRISYPDNFGANTPSVKGDTKFSLVIKGYRQDCEVKIDILPAKGLTVEKIFTQNQAKFSRVAGTGETTIAGLKAMFLNYTPAKDIASRAYFVVKNDQVYRIIVNYFAPKRSDFLPAFEKTVGSLKIS